MYLEIRPVIKNISARSLGSEDDKHVWADIKMMASLSATGLDQFAIKDMFSNQLWLVDGEPKFSELDGFKLKRKFENIDAYFSGVDFEESERNFLEAVEAGDFDTAIKGQLIPCESGYLQKITFDVMSGNSALVEMTYSAMMPGMQIGQMIDRFLNEQIFILLYQKQEEMEL